MQDVLGILFIIDVDSYQLSYHLNNYLGDIFSLGFGPFRWICASGDEEDLILTDKIAQNCFEKILSSSNCIQIFFSSRYT